MLRGAWEIHNNERVNNVDAKMQSRQGGNNVWCVG